MNNFLIRKLNLVLKINKINPIVNCYHDCKRHSSTSSSYFVTTPIFYVNAEPHIGHLHSLLVADAFHRFNQLQGSNPTLFSTGSDEHGIKVQRAAESRGVKPQEFCNQISGRFNELCQEFNVSNTTFVRTTDDNHKKAVQIFWNKLQENGYIYKSKYQGWYCSSDEAFVTSVEDVITQCADGNKVSKKVSSESGNEVEWIEEENYMFKLSEFKEPLLKWLNQKPQVIIPDVFHSIVKKTVQEELQDLSISRPSSRLKWAIQVPNDPNQTIYVWLDALVNYLTVAGYPNTELKMWPPNLQVIGKDILKFHAIYWPAFLMAAGLEPPKRILCHSHWTISDLKMSKSKGNVVDPFKKSEEVTSEGLRYFLLRQGLPHQDGNYHDAYLKILINNELINTFGNLLGRTTGKAINPKQVFPTSRTVAKFGNALSKKIESDLRTLPDFCAEHYAVGNFFHAIEKIMGITRNVNLLFQETEPWKLIKVASFMDKWEWIQFVTMESLRVMSILLQPIIPVAAKRSLDRLGIPEQERSWKHADYKKEKLTETPIGDDPRPLFPRLRS